MRLKIHDLVRNRALVTRDSAKLIRESLVDRIGPEPGEMTLDFAGVDAVTPSFVDELLGVIDEVVGILAEPSFRLVFENAPTRLSAKFAAVGRSRGLEIKEEGAMWLITRRGNELPQNRPLMS